MKAQIVLFGRMTVIPAVIYGQDEPQLTPRSVPSHDNVGPTAATSGQSRRNPRLAMLPCDKTM